jgi:hypothetical protein
MTMPNHNFVSSQDKLMFNYQPNVSPFIKKQGLDESNVIGNILDELGESRISYANYSMREDPEVKLKLESLEKEK